LQNYYTTECKWLGLTSKFKANEVFVSAFKSLAQEEKNSKGGENKMKTTKEVEKTVAEMRVRNLDKINKAVEKN